MLKHKRLGIGLALAALILVSGATAWIAGCTVNVGDDGVSTSFTIGNKTVTIGLGPAGIFIVAANVPVTNIVDAAGFLGGTPTDNPTTGTVRLRASSVTLRSSTAGKGMVAAQTVSGQAMLRWAIDAPGAVDPCTTGIDLGTFEINVADNGVIHIVDEELSLTLAAVSLFLQNNISMCLRMEADFGATIEISGFDVIFGPSDKTNDGLIGTFQLSNLGLTNVHLLGPGEEAGEANLLTPGIVRNSRFENLSINDLLTFTAVRDGQALDTATCPRVNQGDFFAVVQWDGFTLTCFQPTAPPNGPPPLRAEEACCGATGACEMANPTACFSLFEGTGIPQGVDSTCTPGLCQAFDPDAPEACCVPPQMGYEFDPPQFGGIFEEGCADIGALPFETREDCLFFGAVPQGPGSTCANLTCTGNFVACCFQPPQFGSGCLEMTFDDCVTKNGDPQAFGVHCDDFPCNYACCFDDGRCDDMRPDTCVAMNGTPGQPGYECSVVDCKGACCKPDGTCEQMTLAECDTANGTYKGLDVVCDADTCPEALGGCCFDDTLTCFTQTETECLNSGGDPLPNCEGSGFDLCRIACCLPDGTCKDGLTVDECTAQNGIDDARGTTCANITCAPVGPTKWVLAETLVNPDNNTNDYVGTDRFEGTVVTYTETANSITYADRDVDHGFENYNVTIVTSFPTPPSELVPGETVVLDVTFTHSGAVQAFNPGVRFQYRRNGIDIDPGFAYAYFPWDPNGADFGLDGSISYSFVVPTVSAGAEIDLVAFLWNCGECNVFWIYRPE